ncbi:hypothetical protein JZ751_026027 [Albula glossodonta]|uniref:Sema domain-containing protein n=1 Tax=Albula glossodonta TaxID=121402 RepID=A0A8T2MRJ3_9TELE|nr:hypothetical protein JZ751_026027 [Albula glossodonta]
MPCCLWRIGAAAYMHNFRGEECERGPGVCGAGLMSPFNGRGRGLTVIDRGESVIICTKETTGLLCGGGGDPYLLMARVLFTQFCIPFLEFSFGSFRQVPTWTPPHALSFSFNSRAPHVFLSRAAFSPRLSQLTRAAPFLRSADRVFGCAALQSAVQSKPADPAQPAPPPGPPASAALSRLPDSSASLSRLHFGDCHNYIRLLEFTDVGRIYVCGTYAFDPQCAVINMEDFSLETTEDGAVRMETGKGKCPFEPSQHYTAVMADGVLYAATTSNFLGTLFDISRATGSEGERIRTEQSINWLSGETPTSCSTNPPLPLSPIPLPANHTALSCSPHSVFLFLSPHFLFSTLPFPGEKQSFTVRGTDPEFVSSSFIKEQWHSPTGDDDKIYFFFTEVAKDASGGPRLQGVLMCYLCPCATCAPVLPVPLCYLCLCVTCACVLPVPLCYLCLCVTCAPVLPVLLCYLCPCATCACVLPVPLCYLCLCVTCACVLPVPLCYLCLCVTCAPVLPVLLCYLCPCATCAPVLPVPLCYLCLCVTCAPVLPVLLCYLCPCATCACVLLVPLCYLCLCVTCAPVLPVLLCYLCPCATCASVLPVPLCYLCLCVTCAPVLPVLLCYLCPCATCACVLPVPLCYLCLCVTCVSGDVGGMKTLQKRWTTFLKAQLVCEDRASGQRYNILTNVFTKEHQPGEPSTTHFYGIFTSQWEKEELSAVCVYSLADINRVMAGPFKELKKSCDWMIPEPVPHPRPGQTMVSAAHSGLSPQCITSELKTEGFESSLKLPDKVLTFVRDHPLMENSVVAAPLLVRRGITYTRIAVTLTSAANGNQGNVAVLLLGTGKGGGGGVRSMSLSENRGELHRVAVLGQNATLLQEIPLFTAQEPVNNILLYQDQALVGSPLSLVRVIAEGCGVYPSCEECAPARALGCVWSPKEMACTPTLTGVLPADEDALKLCDTGEARCVPVVQELRVFPGLRVVLQCAQVSPRPCRWEHPPARHTRQRHANLEVTVTADSLGTYTCYCEEGRSCPRASYTLALEGPQAGGAVGLAGSRQVLALYLLCFVVGVVLGGCLLYLFGKRRSPTPSHGHAQKGRDLLPSSDTPQSPSSASLLSEAVPLTEKRNGTLNGHGNIYTNTSGLKLQDSALNLAQEMDSKGVGPGEGPGEGEGLGEGLRLEEEIAAAMKEGLPMVPASRGAPLAQCEESSI